MSEIPIADPDIGPDEHRRVQEVLDSGRLADGPTVRSFEAAFADFCGADHGVATSNGTTALETAVRAVGLDADDTVLTSPFSFIASANAIQLAGPSVAFADIDPETYNLDPKAVEAAVADREVDAILAVHLYGLPAPMDRLREIADEYDCLLIEDAAQAHGAAIDGRRTGSLGDAACFSFYPTKNMTTGEGGMVLTDDADIAERAARFVNHGRTEGYEHATVGHNYRLTSISGALGLAQLEKLPDYTAARRAHAEALSEALAPVESIITPTEPDGFTHVYHQYTVRTDDREMFRSYLDAADVDTAVYYPTPIHHQPPYDHLDVRAPEAERAAKQVVSLPVHPGLSDADVDRLTTLLRAYGRIDDPTEIEEPPTAVEPGGESDD
ncbi:DegT/DnrJ/EryC1/StrS family aminotransferase [Halohasta litorea]|uniref:DegT/DnrJ/EryC1/StrS family aminotransferase n=1 Tax=Halohasta litorea TaxID=869891 RepID=A0ABD6D7L2_9EURY|nr:DegT/DnrJ/EryC1/StrS family aminotransferase [Halohasta litorea]